MIAMRVLSPAQPRGESITKLIFSVDNPAHTDVELSWSFYDRAYNRDIT